MSTRILLVDDHQMMRQGLRSMLEKQPDIEVIAEAENGRIAVQLAAELSPHVVILDIAMPDMNGIEAARRITREKSNIKVIALSMHSDRRFVSEMLRAGALGYVLKDSAFEELAQAIRTVAAGEIYLSPKIAGLVLTGYIHHLSADESSAASILTNREREVLQLLAEGKSTKGIAFALGVSVKTIETHRQNMMRKLGVYSVAELTKYAVREGLTDLEP
jgi:DNA-binding NarL/FixJ family response regulator